jgi:hypothetical protein
MITVLLIILFIGMHPFFQVNFTSFLW